MAEAATAERVGGSHVPAPEHRGSLQIESRVISQIARQAALEVDGVVPYSVTLGSLTGRNLPRALADSDPRHPAITVEIAVSWPMPAVDVAERVQQHVIEVVTRLTGRRPARVDVEVTEVVQSRMLLGEELAGVSAAEPGADTGTQAAPTHSRTRGGPPRSFPTAGWLAPVLGLGLLALAVVAGREYAVVQGHYQSEAWIEPSARWVSGTEWRPWMVVVAVVCVLVGLYFVYAAVRPRRRTHRPLRVTGVWTRDTDVARRLSAIALDDSNTVSATTKVTSGRAHVRVFVTSPTESDLSDRLEASAATLAHPPRVSVDLRGVSHPSLTAIDEREPDAAHPERS